MVTIVVILAIVGGLGVLLICGLVFLELLADQAQRNGDNWFR